MPRDQRLYMTFPIDFDEHPKIEALSDSAFRTFVAMNGYSRRHNLDGRIPLATARRRWKARALTELTMSHPDRPLVLLEGDVYAIRDYTEHQLTSADIEDLREKRVAAGRAGGRASARASAVANGEQMASKPTAESRVKSQELISDDVTYLPASSPEVDARDSGFDVSESIQRKAKALGIRNLEAAARHLTSASGEKVSAHGAVLLVQSILDSAKGIVKNVDAYVATVCRNTPEEVRHDYDVLDIGAVA